MIKGLILVNAYSKLHSQKNQIERLRTEFGNLGVDVDVQTNAIFPALIDEDAVCILDKPYDFVLYLDKDKYTSKIIEDSGMRVFDSADSIEKCDDKMLTHIALAGKGIKMPITIPGLLCYTPNSEIDMESVFNIEQVLKYPLVMKESYGSLGKAVYLINNREELIEKTNELINIPHLYQEFIASSYGVDIRVIVIGGKAFAWMKRVSENDFRSNIEQGGQGVTCELREEYRLIAEKTAKVLKLDYCGIDLLIGPNGEPVVCEVNSNAFFNEMEKVTGKNVAKAYAEHIIKSIKKN